MGNGRGRAGQLANGEGCLRRVVQLSVFGVRGDVGNNTSSSTNAVPGLRSVRPPQLRFAMNATLQVPRPPPSRKLVFGDRAGRVLLLAIPIGHDLGYVMPTCLCLTLHAHAVFATVSLADRLRLLAIVAKDFPKLCTSIASTSGCNVLYQLGTSQQ